VCVCAVPKIKHSQCSSLFLFPFFSFSWRLRLPLCSACGSTHTESAKLYRKVKHRSPPKSFLTTTAKARPVRRRSRRSQRRGAPHTEHGLGVAKKKIRAYGATRLYTLSHELPALTALAQHTTHSHSRVNPGGAIDIYIHRERRILYNVCFYLLICTSRAR